MLSALSVKLFYIPITFLYPGVTLTGKPKPPLYSPITIACFAQTNQGEYSGNCEGQQYDYLIKAYVGAVYQP